ncbi:FKBP-type peptidyl-prolyl cis-trans isomerase [Hymenobacter rubidus]|uniref:FKBP-type peptidyl-prolyl cis-trans isomerase n=1 Tax=Hymenobacter rubidus TaxID=1441626 RepID=UPI00191FAF82|nr:FKBP-type peptidyl-prolyl cis-trans isomerase [Hymenobacter rubidus]
MKRYLFAFAATLLLPFVGKAQAPAAAGPFERLPTGTEYRLFRKDAAGHYQARRLAPADAPYASRAGHVLTVFLEFRTGRDSVLMNSRRMQPAPQPVLLPEKPIPGGMEEALGLLLPGDSAVFRFPADSLFAKTFHQAVPPFVQKSGNTLLVLASARELLTMEAMKARQEKLQAEYAQKAKAMAAGQMAKDDAQIQAYLKKNHATARKTPGGTYYIMKKLGTGVSPKTGQTVRVLYRGTVLATGQEFDSSAKHGNEPIAFALGTGQVIPGWDQGIAMLTKGSKAVLLIPSPLAYGAQGAGADIPANAVLRFEVELVDFK